MGRAEFKSPLGYNWITVDQTLDFSIVSTSLGYEGKMGVEKDNVCQLELLGGNLH